MIRLAKHSQGECPGFAPSRFTSCTVSVESFTERPDKELIDIGAEIICEKQSHKGMIIGKGGKMLKKIGSAARVKIEELLQCRVYLQLWVKVRDDWRNDERQLDSLGY